MGLLCTLGVLSGTALRATDGAHHRSPAVAAAKSVVHSHAGVGRADQGLVAVTAGAVADPLQWTRSSPASSTAYAGIAVDSVRTRGPPVLA